MTYDLSGRRRTLRHPGTVAPSGSVPVRYVYNTVGAVDSVVSPYGQAFGFRYDAAGRMDSIAYPNPTGIAFSYDSDGRPTGRYAYSTYPDVGGGDIINERVWYNAAGRVDSVWDFASRVRSEFKYTGHGAVAFSEQGYWDGPWEAGTYRMTVADWSNVDALGNRRAHVVVTGLPMHMTPAFDTTTYDADRGWRELKTGFYVGDQWHWATDNAVNDGAGNQHLTTRFRSSSYCVNGDAVMCWLHETQQYGETIGRYYAADQQLFHVDMHSNAPHPGRNDVGGLEDFRYDALGRRVLRYYQSRFIDYPIGDDEYWSYLIVYFERTIWDGDQVLYEIRAPGNAPEDDDAGNTVNDHLYGRVTYVHGPRLDQPLMTLRADQPSGSALSLYLYADWRGEITAGTWPGGWVDGRGPSSLVDWQAKRVTTWREQLSQFQEVASGETWMGSLLSSQRNGTRDLYNRNRYYDPASGRFTQEDPIGLAGGLNLYGFAGGDPVNFSDPFGLCTPWPACANVYWDDAAVAGHQQGGLLGGLRAAGAVLMGSLIEGFGINEADRGMDEIANGNVLRGAAIVGLAIIGNLPGGNLAKIEANLARTVKAAQGAEVTARAVGGFTQATWTVLGREGGASRTVWNKVINSEGKTIRLYHDSYDAAGVFQHRKFKVPDEHIAR